ncbi:MAG: HlyD family efflux transporter periplasmic adaptor subunit [Desulfobacterales bacterium]|nr:HlyD family efflux transporter periplasmic adaptor subunit [Desulfobacterales bacterium]
MSEKEQSTSQKKKYSEKEFSSAKFSEIMAEIPHVAQRGILYLTCLGVFVGSVFLYCAKIHVVVTARGKIIPQGERFLVQAYESGIVNQVLAQPGDRLNKGDPILKIDRIQSDVDISAKKRKLELLTIELNEFNSALTMIQTILHNPEHFLKKDQPVIASGNIVTLINQLKQAWLDMQTANGLHIESFQKKKIQMQKEILLTQQKIDLLIKNKHRAQEDLQKEELSLEKKKKNLEETRQLTQRGIFSIHDLEIEEERYRNFELSAADNRKKIDQMDLEISNEKLRMANLEVSLQTEEMQGIKQYQSAELNYKQRIASLHEGFEKISMDTKRLEAEITNTKEELEILNQRMIRTTIQMPVTGIISEFQVKNPGEVVTEGKMIAIVIPENTLLLVRAFVPSRDVGFVTEGLAAKIKVDAYPFQQYGTIGAKVMKVYADIKEEDQFAIELELLNPTLVKEKREYPLFPGLTVQVELLAQKKRLYELFLNKYGL